MIDWIGVAIAATWIGGLAVMLAVLGFARTENPKSIRQALRAPRLRWSMIGGALLFALGMGLSAVSGWEKIGWVVVMILLVWEGVSARRTKAG